MSPLGVGSGASTAHSLIAEAARPAPLTVVIRWPTYETVTPGGRVSKSKRAGRLVPWLSANVVSNLPRPVYHDVSRRWRLAALAAAPERVILAGWGTLMAEVHLHKRTANPMDPLAVLEGVKPCIDGLVDAGVLDDDSRVIGGVGLALKAAARETCRVTIVLRPWR